MNSIDAGWLKKDSYTQAPGRVVRDYIASVLGQKSTRVFLPQILRMEIYYEYINIEKNRRHLICKKYKSF